MQIATTSNALQSACSAAVIAACVLLPSVALAQAPSASQAPQASQSPQSQQTPPAAAAAAPAPELQNGWPVGEVTKELARCTQLLKGLDIVARPSPPVKDKECGAPAPLELISVGRSPQVAFSPPVTVTCDLAAALHRWIKGDLQPLARKHLGAEIVRIDTMSSYSCRTAYGRKNARLSEHGKANALDIRAFMTAKGNNSEVLADWGPTGREIAAQVAAAKKYEAEHPVAKAPSANGVVATSPQPAAPSGVSTGSIAGSAIQPGLPALRPSIAIGPRDGGGIGLPLPSTSNTGLGLSTGMGNPNRLGGPKATEGATIVVGHGPKTDFLRAAHNSACRIFGTVLGPEANSAHRNHFHVDMAARKVKSICE